MTPMIVPGYTAAVENAPNLGLKAMRKVRALVGTPTPCPNCKCVRLAPCGCTKKS